MGNNSRSVKTGVLLVNLGTPDAPTPKAVRRYLAEFLWDKRVVDFPRPLWWMILNLIILNIRPPKVAKAYQEIWWDDGAPLRVISERQTEKLQNILGETLPVSLGMTYGNPSIAKGIADLTSQGVKRIIVLSLYPQYSSATHGSVFDVVAKSVRKQRFVPEFDFVQGYYDFEPYINALATSVKNYWQEHGKPSRLLMSFHGIPKRYYLTGDPYPEHCEATARALASALSLSESEWSWAYQSRFGREEWLKPYTDKTLESWGKENLERVDVMCPAFSVDCLETLEEIAGENKDLYQEAGGKDFRYIPCLNDSDDHIEMMKLLVEEKL